MVYSAQLCFLDLGPWGCPRQVDARPPVFNSESSLLLILSIPKDERLAELYPGWCRNNTYTDDLKQNMIDACNNVSVDCKCVCYKRKLSENLFSFLNFKKLLFKKKKIPPQWGNWEVKFHPSPSNVRTVRKNTVRGFLDLKVTKYPYLI